jgi:glycerol-3-phosphate cytidylyltransferase
MKKYQKGYTTGVYDMFHIGHLNIIRNAKSVCDFLVVGVTTDELCFSRKKKYPIIPFDNRVKIVEAIRYVDQVVSQSDMDKVKAARELGCDVVIVGDDWKGTDAWNRYEEELKKYNIDVVYCPHTDGISSTLLRETIKNGEK